MFFQHKQTFDDFSENKFRFYRTKNVWKAF